MASTFEVRGREYEFPTKFRVCDPVLVREVTGLAFQDFADQLSSTDDEEGIDPVVLAGLIAVGIWQKFPTWKRGQVVRYVEQIGPDEFTITTAPEVGPPEAGDDGPLAQTETDSQESSGGSNSD